MKKLETWDRNASFTIWKHSAVLGFDYLPEGFWLGDTGRRAWPSGQTLVRGQPACGIEATLKIVLNPILSVAKAHATATFVPPDDHAFDRRDVIHDKPDAGLQIQSRWKGDLGTVSGDIHHAARCPFVAGL
jgi:hypothetical protein